MSERFSLPLNITTANQRTSMNNYCEVFVINDSFNDELCRLPEDVDSHAVVTAINSHDTLVDQVEKLSPLVEIVSNQKQRIQQLEEASAHMKDALNIIAGWNEHTAEEKSNMGSWGEQRHYRDIAISAMGDR